MEHHEQTTGELISSLADDQLGSIQWRDSKERLLQDDELLPTWHCYQVIGDVMRAELMPDPRRDRLFLEQWRSRLASEALVHPLGAVETPESAAPVHAPVTRPSANDDSFAWRWVAGLAVVGIVGTLAWSSFSRTDPTDRPVLAARDLAAPGLRVTASAPPAADLATGNAVLLRDPRLDQWMQAHQRYGGGSALQVPVGFVRNASLEGAAR